MVVYPTIYDAKFPTSLVNLTFEIGGAWSTSDQFLTKGSSYSRHKMVQEICFWIYMNEYLAKYSKILIFITLGITMFRITMVSWSPKISHLSGKNTFPCTKNTHRNLWGWPGCGGLLLAGSGQDCWQGFDWYGRIKIAIGGGNFKWFKCVVFFW